MSGVVKLNLPMLQLMMYGFLIAFQNNILMIILSCLLIVALIKRR